LSKVLLTHAIKVIQQNADMVRYFQPKHKHVINSDAAIVLLKKFRRGFKESPGTVRSKRPAQQTKAKICPECGSSKVIIFTSNDDMCNKCGKTFPGT